MHAGGQRFDPARLHHLFLKKALDYLYQKRYNNRVALTMIFEN
ncbi:Type II toxin-antitoxin system RelE/ParE family toxin [Bacillus sp. IT-13CA1]